jgi:hypothetical protein
MVGPFDGVKVVEITMFQQGPIAGMRLGDLDVGKRIRNARPVYPIQTPDDPF